MAASKGLTFGAAAVYQIVVRGRLNQSWSDRMHGVDEVRVQTLPDEALVTVLTGHFIDQAELAGVLNTLFDLGFPLLSVECLGVIPDV